jgi:hypothetical protein
VRKILDEKVSVMEKMLSDLEPPSTTAPPDKNPADTAVLPAQEEEDRNLSSEEERREGSDLLAPLGKTVMNQLSSSLLLDREESLPPSLATFPLVLQLSELDCPKFCINIQVKGDLISNLNIKILSLLKVQSSQKISG